MNTQAVVDIKWNQNLHLSDDTMDVSKDGGPDLKYAIYRSPLRGGSESRIRPSGEISNLETPVDLGSLDQQIRLWRW